MKKLKKETISLRTDLIFEKNSHIKPSSLEKPYPNIEVKIYEEKEKTSTTIFFQDIRNHHHLKQVQEVFVNTLKQYMTISSSDVVFIIGLGNEKSTPDALGPTVVENVLVTRHLFLLGEVEKGYHNVCSFVPNVMVLFWELIFIT